MAEAFDSRRYEEHRLRYPVSVLGNAGFFSSNRPAFDATTRAEFE
jgi:hypothetical protein